MTAAFRFTNDKKFCHPDMKHIPESIIISRTDSIGDVILTLPMAKILKNYFPGIKIAFLGRAYTRPVIETAAFIDEFIDIADFMRKEPLIGGQKPGAILHVFPAPAIASRAKKLRIPIRIGTTNRLYHWFNCNYLVRLSRRNSSLHEAQLNLKLLRPFGINKTFSLEEIAGSMGMEKINPLERRFSALIDPGKYKLILHPKSQGSAREWGEENFVSLIRSLDAEKFQLFISGTEKEGESLASLFEKVRGRVTDLTGKMTLSQFIAFISHCDGIVANSTGPLHIGAALNKDSFGIYSPMHPIHPGRWAPLGKKTHVFVLNRDCNDCANEKSACHCIREVKPESVKQALEKASAGIQVSL